MTDKVQKIREEVEKIAKSINPFLPDEDGKNSEYEAGRFAMVTQILQYIDSMQEEPVSEDLSAEIDHLSKRYPEVSFAKLSRIAVHIAKWQKDNTIRKVAKWLYANFYISKEYVSKTSILPIPKYAHNATMGQFISEFIKHMKKE